MATDRISWLAPVDTELYDAPVSTTNDKISLIAVSSAFTRLDFNMLKDATPKPDSRKVWIGFS